MSSSPTTHPYKYLLFDLDHTLWDFERNSSETLDQLYYEFELDILLKITSEQFIQTYSRVNFKLWKDYESGTISKSDLRHERFFQTLTFYGLHNRNLAIQLSEKYLAICPYKTNLIPKSEETLNILHAHFKMIIVTNGFEEIQAIKMKHSGLDKYFDHVVSSEQAGSKKPAGPIFKHALDLLGGTRKESLMIGDNFHSDIIGAKKFGLDQVYYNPKKNRHNQKPTFDIRCISELTTILV